MASQLREADRARACHANAPVASGKFELDRAAQRFRGNVAPGKRMSAEADLAVDLAELRRAGDPQFVADELIFTGDRCRGRRGERKIEVEREPSIAHSLRAVAEMSDPFCNGALFDECQKVLRRSSDFAIDSDNRMVQVGDLGVGARYLRAEYLPA